MGMGKLASKATEQYSLCHEEAGAKKQRISLCDGIWPALLPAGMSFFFEVKKVKRAKQDKKGAGLFALCNKASKEIEHFLM